MQNKRLSKFSLTPQWISKATAFAFASLALITSSLQSGCTTEAYCFNCTGPQQTGGEGGEGGEGGQGGSGGGINLGGSGGTTGQGGGIITDQPCNADLQNDPKNCGACGFVCQQFGALPGCIGGKCVYTCAPGYLDLNSNTNGNDKDGCEYPCTPTNNGVEICDGIDNNCDGKIDEGINKNTLENCGACGKKCVFSNGTGVCENGVCKLTACNSGFTDNKKSPEFDCDYKCSPTNNGVEICDGKDNNCNGEIDEGTNIQTDPDNCGVCGKSCPSIANSVPTCEGGKCIAGKTCEPGYFDIDPSKPGCEGTCIDTCKIPNAVVSCTPSCKFVQCALNYYDLNKDAPTADGKNGSNGCEYFCEKSNNGVEICDGKDNNCDGKIDEGFSLTSNQHCGVCGNDCTNRFPNASGSCGQVNGKPDCVMGACKSGFINLNKDSTDGCEFICVPSNGGVEICDGKDNDCNGLVDDNPQDPTFGKACGVNIGICKAGTNQCVAGKIVCVGQVTPQPEVCDAPNKNDTSAQYDNDCDGQVDPTCMYAYATNPPIRLDINQQSKGDYAVFGLTSASAGDEFLVAYPFTSPGDNDPDIFVRGSLDGGKSWGTSDVRAIPSPDPDVEPSVFMRQGRGYVAWSRMTNNVRRIYVSASNSPYTSWTALASVPRIDAANNTVDCYSPKGIVARRDPANGTNDFIAVLWSEIGGNAFAPTRNIYLNFSKNGGVSWSTPRAVNVSTGTTPNNRGELPVIATDGAGVVYVAWRDTRLTNRAQVYFTRINLNDTNPTFQETRPLQPNSIAAANAEQVVIAADSTGAVNVAWVDLRDKAKTIRVATSTNRGDTWKLVGGQVDGAIVHPDNTIADTSAPAIAARNGRVAIVWQDTRNGKSDIYANRSLDAGITWNTTTRRVDAGDAPGANASLTPSIAFGTNLNVLVAWQDQRHPASSVLANISVDGGANYASTPFAPFRMDLDVGGVGSAADSQNPQMLASTNQNRASVVWLDFRNAQGNNSTNGHVWSRFLER